MADGKDSSSKAGHNSKNVDWAKAAALLTGKIAGIDEKTAKLRGDMSAAKNQLEEMGVNKRGANFVASLHKAGTATASDILRTVVMLCNELDIGITKDMVDDAEGSPKTSIPLIETPSVDV